MAFKEKVKNELKIDCKDFKPKFWDREHCKLINECSNAGKEYILDTFIYHPDECTGIEYPECPIQRPTSAPPKKLY